MKRLAMGIEYDGRGYLGWQRQRQSPTVQEVLEQAISLVADQRCVVHAAGRTDTGVHARCQVAHYDSSAKRTERQWLLGINSHLPTNITVLWVQQVSADFHARFSAKSRSYEYLICNRVVRPALQNGLVAWVRKPLNHEHMHAAAQQLLGEHDFSSFRAQGCQAHSPQREVQAVSVSRSDDLVRLHIRANAFLYHMVRNISGSLIDVGLGRHEPAHMHQLLLARDRKLAGVTAPAHGLYFLQAEYADTFALPSMP